MGLMQVISRPLLSLRGFRRHARALPTKHAPWFIIPSNHKWLRNLAVSSIIADTLEDMKIEMPKPAVDIEKIRQLYHQAEVEEENGKKKKEPKHKDKASAASSTAPVQNQ